MRAVLLLSLAGLAGATLGGCLGEPIRDPAPAGHSDAHHPAAQQSSDASIQTVDVTLHVAAGGEGAELAYAPQTIHAPLGKSIELLVHNNGTAPHTFTVDALALDTGALQPGQYAALRFHAAQAGSFEAMCDRPGHAGSGMIATLEVA